MASSPPLPSNPCQSFATVDALIEVAVADGLTRLGTRVMPEALRRPLEKLRARKALLIARQPGAPRALLEAWLRIHAAEIGLLSLACVTAQGAYCCAGACVPAKPVPGEAWGLR
ncbi:hypothetical protein [Cupriavidus basilensis]